jgi:glycosyltransferase involved in cell wall biosynthesis
VAILLCTHQGQAFLERQLASFPVQTWPAWAVHASDDGSSDGTAAILEAHRRAWGAGRLSILTGPGRGFVANFLALTCRPEIHADAYAYSDQDDVWEPGKLERAMRWLIAVPPATPALYCSRTRLIDERDREVGMSPLFRRQPGFANALVQSLAGGNTMVFNDAARQVIVMAAAAGAGANVPTHDWWTYLIVSGCGGRVHYDPEPMVRYRQHDGNQIGSNTLWRERMYNVRRMMAGRLRGWHDRNIAALEIVGDRLTPGNRRTLDTFRQARQRTFVPRVVGTWRSGVYRQTAIGNIGLGVAACFNRL